MENFTYEGYWWRPDAPDDDVPGTLVFDRHEGLRLSLMGSLDRDPALTMLDETETVPVILGLVERKLVTLEKCLSLGTGMSAPGYARARYHPEIAYVGPEHFPDSGNIQLDAITLELSHLPDWAPKLSGGRLRVGVRDLGLDSYTVTYCRPDSLIAHTPTAAVSLGIAVTVPMMFSRVFTIRETVTFRAEREDTQHLEQWLSGFVGPLQNLLSLATRRPNAVLRLSVQSPTVTYELGDGGMENQPFEVYYQGRYVEAEDEPRKRLLPHEMLFTLDDVSDRFEEVVARWLQVAVELTDVCNRFFGVRYRSMYSEHRFESMVQALEGYHRASPRFENTRWPHDDYKELADRLLEACPEGYREQWLSPWLEYANEPSLRVRLRELFDDTAEIVDGLVGKRKDFIGKVVDARNAIAHPHGATRVPDSLELFLLTRQLEFVMEGCLLREIGLPLSHVTELPDYKFEARRGQRRREED